MLEIYAPAVLCTRDDAATIGTIGKRRWDNRAQLELRKMG